MKLSVAKRNNQRFCLNSPLITAVTIIDSKGMHVSIRMTATHLCFAVD